LLGDALQQLTELSRILRVAARHHRFLRCLVLRSLRPIVAVALNPVAELPTAPADDGQGKHVLRPLGFFVVEQSHAALRPLVAEGLVMDLFCQPLHLDEEDEAVGTVGSWNVGRHERVVHGGQTLLAVEDDVLTLTVSTCIAVDRLAGEGFEILLLPLPEQHASDVVIEEEGPHQVADVLRSPLELTLEVRDHEAAFFEVTKKGPKAAVIGLLCVSHDTPASLTRLERPVYA